MAPQRTLYSQTEFTTEDQSPPPVLAVVAGENSEVEGYDGRHVDLLGGEVLKGNGHLGQLADDVGEPVRGRQSVAARWMRGRS